MHPRQVKTASDLTPEEIESVRLAESGLTLRPPAPSRLAILPGYESLAAALDEALEQAQGGKGRERHAMIGEAFEDQQIIQLGEWMHSTAFAIGQACKKLIESTRLPPERARIEIRGAINYAAAALIQLYRDEDRTR